MMQQELDNQADIQLPERKKWDKSEWEAKAKEKDAKYREQAIEAEKSMAKGKSPPSQRGSSDEVGIKPKFREQDDRPEPTQSLQAREALDLNKNVGKTQIVQSGTSGKGPKGPGFYVSPPPSLFIIQN
jgi:U4/U6.U5 tri-snRNP component SNU23